MKVISILLAFLNSLVGGLLILSCVAAGEIAGVDILQKRRGSPGNLFWDPDIQR